MTASPIQITGGGFQDITGNPLAEGYLIFELSTDTTVGGIYICSGVTIRIQLDADGNVAAGQHIWGNDAMSPESYYRVTGFTAQGQPSWGPNNQSVTGSGTFDIGTWVPNRR
jgi:hypothetical protein